MAPIKIDHIVSFSSEDPVHPANNLLSSDTSKIWKCQAVGEKQAIVVLQLEKASQITAIDIGNEHSAYIEVLVSRSSNSDDYKVLLVTSSFMTPLEARQSQNINKVRMFTQDQLSKPECDEKWDRIKIVCTQPFNKHVQFGISFVTLHSNESKLAAPPNPTKIGNFSIRPKSPDMLSAGNLFAKRKDYKQNDKTTTAAAAIRDASSSSSLLYDSPSCKPKLSNKNLNSTPKAASNNEEPSRKDRNRNELYYDEDDLKGNEKINNIMNKKEKEVQSKTKDDEKVSQKAKRLFGDDDDEDAIKKKQAKRPNLFDLQDSDKKTKSPRKGSNSPNTSNRKKEESKETKRKKIKLSDNKKPKKAKVAKPFNKLLENVVLVISGIQNPDRANIRTMALSMGAKYKTDWDPTCTHLICAFPNTPKFNQVKGKGKIVNKHWVENCHSERKRLPWRRFALDKNDNNQSESEDEIEELVKPATIITPVTYQPMNDSDDDDHKAAGSDTEEKVARILEKKKRENTKKDSPKNATYNIQEASTDEETENNLSVFKNKRNCDTPQSSSDDSKITNIFDEDTDDEAYSATNRNNPPPDIFQKEKFYVDQTFDEETYNTLCKYIKAYNGKCIDDVTANVDVIVTTKENSSSMKEINEKAKCVEHKWIINIHHKQKMLPLNDYIL